MNMKTKVAIITAGLLIGSVFGQNKQNMEVFKNQKPLNSQIEYLKIKETIKNNITFPDKGNKQEPKEKRNNTRNAITPPEKIDYFEIENWKSREKQFVYC